ncbi:MAG: SEC-C metal-binding domain-containing protein, partial [Haliea sp.]
MSHTPRDIQYRGHGAVERTLQRTLQRHPFLVPRNAAPGPCIYLSRGIICVRFSRLRGPDVVQPGRNDPCPCGSDKKYKKCCGAGAGTTPSAARGLPGSLDGAIAAFES